MHPGFQGDPAPRHASQHFLHGFRSRPQLLFQQHCAGSIQHAIPTRSIAQVQPDRQFLLSKILVCFVAAVLTFFIAGLLYLLCFEHVDNLGAYSIPSETGLLIPSDYNN